MWSMFKINKKRHENDVDWHEHTVNWRRPALFIFNFEHILLLHSSDPPHLFKGGGIKFDYLPRKEEGTWKIKKKE